MGVAIILICYSHAIGHKSKSITKEILISLQLNKHVMEVGFIVVLKLIRLFILIIKFLMKNRGIINFIVEQLEVSIGVHRAQENREYKNVLEIWEGTLV